MILFHLARPSARPLFVGFPAILICLVSQYPLPPSWDHPDRKKSSDTTVAALSRQSTIETLHYGGEVLRAVTSLGIAGLSVRILQSVARKATIFRVIRARDDRQVAILQRLYKCPDIRHIFRAEGG